MKPTKIRKISVAELSVEWDDGHRGRHTMATLRRYCPCASCKTEAEGKQDRPLLPILQPGQNDLVAIEQVGNYAIQLAWADGHRTGIYTFDYLRQICECDECMKRSQE